MQIKKNVMEIINFINILNKENVEIEFFIPDTVSDTIYT